MTATTARSGSEGCRASLRRLENRRISGGFLYSGTTLAARTNRLGKSRRIAGHGRFALLNDAVLAKDIRLDPGA
jgi:hypothetical protein